MAGPRAAAALPPGCPVLYLPGIDGTGRLLFGQRALFARHDVQCMSYPQDDRHNYATLVAEAAARLEESGPGVVLAESFGGGVALLLARARPDLVRRLVLVSTFAYYPHRLYLDALAMAGPFLPRRPGSRNPLSHALRGWFLFGRGIPQQDRALWWDETDDVPLSVYGHRFALIASLDLRALLPHIDVPTLVYASTDDWIVPFSASRLLARRLPRAAFVTGRTGHAALIDPRIDVAAWLADEELWRP